MLSTLPPFSGITAAPMLSLTPTPTAGIRQLRLPSDDIIFDPSRQMIYASVSSIAGNNGNSITVVDPESGTLKGTFPVVTVGVR